MSPSINTAIVVAAPIITGRFFSFINVLAVDRDWGAVALDKIRPVQEQQERKTDFNRQVALLKGNPPSNTDWEAILGAIQNLMQP